MASRISSLMVVLAGQPLVELAVAQRLQVLHRDLLAVSTSRFSTRPESTISTSMITWRSSPTTSMRRSRARSSAGGATMAV